MGSAGRMPPPPPPPGATGVDHVSIGALPSLPAHGRQSIPGGACVSAIPHAGLPLDLRPRRGETAAARDETAHRPRRAVPGDGVPVHHRPRGLSRGPGSVDHAHGQAAAGRRPAAHRRATAAGATVPVATRRGALQLGLPLLGRGSGLRPRLPRARASPAAAADRRQARGAGRADRLPSARPRAPAVGDCM